MNPALRPCVFFDRDGIVNRSPGEGRYVNRAADFHPLPGFADCVRAAAAKGGLPGSVLVSDGFFPFRDGVDTAIAEGVTASAQPGGSMRDFEVIQAVNEASPQVSMVFTGQRSFKH